MRTTHGPMESIPIETATNHRAIDLESDILSRISAGFPLAVSANPTATTQTSTGQPPASPSLATRHWPPATSSIPRCSYTTMDGRRCRSLSEHADSIFCANHARIARRNPDLDVVCPACHRPTNGAEPPPPALAKELLGPIEDFQTSASINHALGRLVILQAQNRIPTRNAAVLAYTFQLLLQTLPETEKQASGSGKQEPAEEQPGEPQ